MSVSSPDRVEIETPRGNDRTAPVVDVVPDTRPDKFGLLFTVELDGHRLQYPEAETTIVPTDE